MVPSLPRKHVTSPCNASSGWFVNETVHLLFLLFHCLCGTFYGHKTSRIGRIFFKKLSDKLILCFQEQESFFHVMLRNYQFMYTAFNWLIG